MNKKIRAKDGKLDLSEFMNDNDLNAYFKRQAKEYIDPDEDKSLLTDKNRYFHELNLIDPIIHALSDLGYHHPTPIQIKVIPVALKKKDIIATAQTGSGKTAAFTIPIIQNIFIDKRKGKSYLRALILSPTRELASQIGDSITEYAINTKVRQVTAYGGVSKIPQIKQLEKGRDIIVATPGRLMDLIELGAVDLDRIEYLVLDEADRLLDMGFIDVINAIINRIPVRSQKMLFSATIPNPIISLGNKILNKPVRISVGRPSSAVDTIDSYVFFVEKHDKMRLLMHLLSTEKMNRVLVFMRTKHRVNDLVKRLRKEKIKSSAIHGDKTQIERERILNRFKNKEISLLIATDLAARGIDISDISHIVNYDMSEEADIYVHRIGRTARAGKSGKAFNFCDRKERRYLTKIERLINKHLIRAENYPYMSDITPPTLTILKKK